MPTQQPIREALRTVMARGADAVLSDDEFNHLALQAFTHQFNLNLPYRKYCERRGCTPADVTDWLRIPAVPTAAFKEVEFVTGDASAAALAFRTSGTTRGHEKRGTHYILDASLYEESLLPTFRAFVMPDRARMRMIALTPGFPETPDSSLNYMIGLVMQRFANGAGNYASISGGLDAGRIVRALEATEPLLLLGTSLAYLHLLDALGERTLQLPRGSRLMDTGGFKGDNRAITADELYARYHDQLGLDEAACVNEYGMTELCSQYYDSALRDGTPARPRVKKGPPWLRARIVDADTLEAVAPGETGILQHFDLANLNSVCAVLTEDLAYEHDGGFVLLGRAPGAQPRGCSIAMDILLQDVAR